MTFTLHERSTSISLCEVSKYYDKTPVIPGLTVELQAGEFTVILGPSGCGKSTLLQMIAGLERVSSGTIKFGDREVHGLEPKQRGCALVFQNYALYPHMSVFDNMVYSLRIAGVKKAERTRRVDAVAELLGLKEYLKRQPSQLSGGQRQRVAIGRAIVREPQVLLFDEPLSNLDAQLRHEMRLELADLHRRIGATTVFVTHDQAEAMTLADRILILNKGRIEQFAEPETLYRYPASVFVAQFIGSPPMNLIPVTGYGQYLQDDRGHKLAACKQRGDFFLGIRPEDIVLAITDFQPPYLPATVLYREALGSHSILICQLSGGQRIQVVTPFGMDTRHLQALSLYFPDHQLHLFDRQSGLLIDGAFSPTT
ncbi:ABC transporter ATP-binding protein [Buttiauxella ferragutiae]|uniref:ABC transporter ATP-binding protein n=1 Tax=Buttiauxella ferragutiae TaxID=82989 RepID=UPI001E63D147|nr:sn-glycerol-3-phosphate ABC transporter ATP-binding protein UgpC [Buttiauxella ferragutiae]MCE0828827.1 sn-glycerol-3-phosphate ABC transporter ATP-binding protein UgpC [Buttiauxella ferragutiae]